ncbi:hypothetical protein DRF65_12875 [Chryseobacterium pennae]|uniref:Uncharacterized protein n=1 Tax=Chryseobacterium pennae TaxID=2258962 RepID=A0A3D9C8L7_9FLAO|nr:hypothetical protein [Chryseobacterium pennae]REC61916.1 hypothetical protein DRF65_12875 [Chryseobacterium pennae]
MGGFIEFYRLDKAKIRENLYPKISDTSLPDVFLEVINKSFGTFRDFLKSEREFSGIFYEKLMLKLQQEDYTLENNEFTALFDWFTWYYQNDHDGNEEIFANHGFVSIWHLTTRYEVPLLFSVTAMGIEEFYIPLLDTSPKLTIDSILSSDELLLMVDYLILLSFKAAVFQKSPDVEEMRKSLEISRFDASFNLHISTEKHLNTYLQYSDYLYRDEMKHLLEGGYEYIPDIMMKIKENLGSYQGPIYLDHSY